MKVQGLAANICEIKWQPGAPGVSIAFNVCDCVCGVRMFRAYKMLTVNKLLANWCFDGEFLKSRAIMGRVLAATSACALVQ